MISSGINPNKARSDLSMGIPRCREDGTSDKTWSRRSFSFKFYSTLIATPKVPYLGTLKIFRPDLEVHQAPLRLERISKEVGT